MDNPKIQQELTELYHELNAAESDLYCFSQSSSIMDSGEENWVRDQERLINSLRAKIKSYGTSL